MSPPPPKEVIAQVPLENCDNDRVDTAELSLDENLGR